MRWTIVCLVFVFLFGLSGSVDCQPINLNNLPSGSKNIQSGMAPNNQPELDIQVQTIDNIIGGAVDDIAFSLPFPGIESIFLDSVYILQGEFADTNFPINFTQAPNLARIITIHGEDDTEFGFSVANAGDLDRDGFGDIAVAAPFAGEAGVVYILGIGTSLQLDPNNPKVNPNTINLGDPQDQGFILLTLGGTFSMPLRQPLGPSADIDGDGLSDIILPAPAFSRTLDGDEILGYIIYGSEDILNTTFRMDELDPENTLTLITPPIPDDGRLNTNFNPIVQSPGDITGDAQNDVIVSLGYASEEPYFASLYVLPGGERRVGTWVAEVTGVGDAQIDLPLFVERNAHALNQITGGDLNNDGVSDLVLSFVQADAKGQDDSSGAVVVVPGGQDITGALSYDAQSERITMLGHAVPKAQFGQSVSVRNNRLLVGAPQTFSPFVQGASTGAVYVGHESSLGANIRDLNAPLRMDAAIYGQFDEQRLGASQDFFVDRSGNLKVVVSAAGDESFPDRVGYILPFHSVGGDVNQDGRRDKNDLFTISRFWQDALPGDGTTVSALQILNAILGLQTY
ncbi:MAG: integrin alpha [Candidatus Hinthialibacter antarcticus]|nr:integrin alpha [Candidatus Hinthialibacter antarcticus]